MIIVLGVTMLVLGFYGWLLWSYVVQLLCLDTNETGCVDVDLPLVDLVFLTHPKYPLAEESKSDNCFGHHYAGLMFLWVSPVVMDGSNTMPGHK